MKLEISIGNVQLAFLAAFVAILLAIGMAAAYNSGGPPIIMGHSLDELELAPLYISTTTNRVGIGTEPQDKLDIDGALRFGPGSFVSGEARAYIGTNYGLVITGEAGATHDLVLTEAGGQQLLANPVGTNDVLLVPLSGGYIGIGTTTPGYKLDILGGEVRIRKTAGNAALTIDAPGYAAVNFRRSGIEKWQIGPGAGGASDDFHFWNTSSKVVAIKQSNGYVGIGTTSPTDKLDVVGGGIHATGDICTDQGGVVCLSSVSGGGGGFWAASGNDIYNNNTGNVGIGATSPSATLDVNGTVRIGYGWRGLKIEGSGTEPHRYDFILGDLGGIPSNAGGFSIYDNTAGEYRFAISKTGNVGIGTMGPDNSELDIEEHHKTPSTKLEDVARVKIGDYQQIGETGLSNIPYHAVNAKLTHSRYSGGEIANKFTPDWYGAPSARMTTINYHWNTGEDIMAVKTYNHGTSGSEVNWTSFSHVYSLRNDGGAYFAGNVGIGTTSPGVNLEVADSAGTAQIEVSGANGGVLHVVGTTGTEVALWLNQTGSGGKNRRLVSDGGALIFTADLTEHMRIDEDGNVGIGTIPDPWILLDIGPDSGANVVRINKGDTWGTNMLQFNSGGFEFASLRGEPDEDFAIRTAGATALRFVTNNQYRMTIDSDGSVGIGTTTPGTNKLEVVGGPIKATGGLIIETRTSDPASPATGQIWLRTDL